MAVCPTSPKQRVSGYSFQGDVNDGVPNLRCLERAHAPTHVREFDPFLWSEPKFRILDTWFVSSIYSKFEFNPIYSVSQIIKIGYILLFAANKVFLKWMVAEPCCVGGMINRRRVRERWRHDDICPC